MMMIGSVRSSNVASSNGRKTRTVRSDMTDAVVAGCGGGVNWKPLIDDSGGSSPRMTELAVP
jgi:hypothetical protein